MIFHIYVLPRLTSCGLIPAAALSHREGWGLGSARMARPLSPCGLSSQVPSWCSVSSSNQVIRLAQSQSWGFLQKGHYGPFFSSLAQRALLIHYKQVSEVALPGHCGNVDQKQGRWLLLCSAHEASRCALVGQPLLERVAVVEFFHVSESRQRKNGHKPSTWYPLI